MNTRFIFNPMDKKRLHVRTVIISDLHLGTSDCKALEVNHFLRHIRCEKLILNGDIIDGWQLQRAGHWTKAHTRFVRIVLKMLEKRDTEVVYVRGNHDDVLAASCRLSSRISRSSRTTSTRACAAAISCFTATCSTRSP